MTSAENTKRGKQICTSNKTKISSKFKAADLKNRYSITRFCIRFPFESIPENEEVIVVLRHIPYSQTIYTRRLMGVKN